MTKTYHFESKSFKFYFIEKLFFSQLLNVLKMRASREVK